MYDVRFASILFCEVGTGRELEWHAERPARSLIIVYKPTHKEVEKPAPQSKSVIDSNITSNRRVRIIFIQIKLPPTYITLKSYNIS